MSMTLSKQASRRLSKVSTRTGGFTLVELLVVIGIIGVLVGILLPSLSRARSSATRAACLSNLRQVHQAFLLYANAHKDQVPLGYRDRTPYNTGQGFRQFSSMVYSGTSQRFVLFGVMLPTRLISQPQVLYCPAEGDARSQYNTPENPWADFAAVEAAGGTGGGTTRPSGLPTANTASGYAARPQVAIPDLQEDWGPKNPLPRLSSFKRSAIFADLLTLPARVDTRHRSGVNVLYGDGSARWVPRAVFNAPLSEITASPTLAANGPTTRVWSALDNP